MDEGIVEGSEDASDAEDEFTFEEISVSILSFVRRSFQILTHLRGPGGQERYSQWRRVRPSSWEAS